MDKDFIPGHWFRYVGRLDLHECHKCKALVVTDGMEAHKAWHESVMNEIYGARCSESYRYWQEK